MTRGPSSLHGVRVGCSGWTYKSWRHRFYPPAVPTTRWLEHYASQFDCVEANGTFYRLPEAATFADWALRTPPGFRMAVKASRFLTHMKRLIDPHEPLDRLLTRVAALGARLGPILYQLPPDLQRNDDRLLRFVQALPGDVAGGVRRRPVHHVVEFRHPSWYVPSVYEMLAAHEVSLCLHDKGGSQIDGPCVGPVVYVRFHGPTGEYHSRYPPAAIDRWADRLAEERGRGKDVWAFFNNDIEGAAVADAADLRLALGQRLISAIATR